MTRRRWIADEVEGERAALVGAHASHLARVLRARVGQEFDIAAGGEVRRGLVLSVSDERVDFELGERVETAEQASLILLLAIFKFDRFEWAVEKCTELGVSAIVPVIARRTDSHLAKAAEKRVERWRKISREAAEQSRRVSPPEIAEPLRLKQALAPEAELRIVLSEVEDGTTLRDLVDGGGARTFALAIGPEGGWTEEELKMFADASWKSASLGDTILRAETAAIAATALVRSW
ncbi:MAG TPA: RsmE family RNA methyltransferase [Clostridia bacterium]|nr:RsmE family RNA methyltransferase [Clostridia bacterium]